MYHSGQYPLQTPTEKTNPIQIGYPLENIKNDQPPLLVELTHETKLKDFKDKLSSLKLCVLFGFSDMSYNSFTTFPTFLTPTDLEEL